MSHYLFEGIVKQVFETQAFKNNFSKREVVVSSDEKYPQDVKFEFTDDNGISMLDSFEIGEKVTVAFLLKGNEYNGKFFTNLRGIAIAAIEDGKAKMKEVPKAPKTTKVETKVSKSDEVEDDDLPF